VSEECKQKEATATRFCLPAAHHLQSEIGSHTSSAHSMTNSVGPSSCERTSPTPTLSESLSQR
jgi:hypothetical protein